MTIRDIPLTAIRADTTEVIYVIQSGEDGPIKIGRTTAARLDHRVRELQTGNPAPLLLRDVFSGDPELEARLHRALEEFRLSGEWFKPSALLYVRIHLSLKEQAANEGKHDLFPDLNLMHDIGRDVVKYVHVDMMSEIHFQHLIKALRAKIDRRLRSCPTNEALEVRREQTSGDTAYLKVLEEAFLTARPIWRANPDWTFGQVCEFLRRRRGAA